MYIVTILGPRALVRRRRQNLRPLARRRGYFEPPHWGDLDHGAELADDQPRHRGVSDLKILC